MTQFVLKRLLLLAPVLFGVTVVVFAVVRVVPGDAAQTLLGTQQTPEKLAQLRHIYGLDRPLYVQYVDWLRLALRGDLGDSLKTGNSVAYEIRLRFPATFELTAAAMVISLLIAIPTGIIAAARPYTIFDYVSTVFALTGIALPNFFLGILLILVFSLTLGLVPSQGYVSLADDPVQNLRLLILPAITLGTSLTAVVTRMMRTSMIEVLQREYIKAARAKGLRERAVVVRHAFKNGLIPVLTVIGLQTGYLLGGAVIVETIFSWPGIGRLTYEAITQRDYPVLQGTVLLVALLFMIVNLAVDVLYAYLDPRIRLQ